MKYIKSMDYMGAIIALKKVVDQQSFSKASVEIGISQPALSKRVKNLENLFEEKLIVKKSGQINLTAIGQIIYEEAVQFEQIDEQIVNKINETKEKKVKNNIGILEQLYLNYEDTFNSLNYEYIFHKNVKSLRKNFDNKKLENILVTKDELNLFVHSKQKLVKQLHIKLFIHKSNKLSKILTKEINQMQQLFYQPEERVSLFPEFLNKHHLLSNNFEYIENFEVLIAELAINPQKIWLTTDDCYVSAKYQELIKEIEVKVPTVDIYMLSK